MQTYLITVAISWKQGAKSPEARYEKLDKIRYIAQNYDFLVQQEARPIAIALFSNSSLIFHLGFDRPNLADADWYKDCNHPYLAKVVEFLDSLTDWQDINCLEFLVAPGDDPMTSLQIKLDRQNYSFAQKPSSLCDDLESQVIYSFSKTDD